MGLLIGDGGSLHGVGQLKAYVLDSFETDKPYKKGRIVLNEDDGLVYRFITSHQPGAWDASEVEQVTMMVSRPVKWMLTLDFDDETTGILTLINADSACVAEGGINQTTGILSVVLTTETDDE